ncbi:MAG: PAS domain S-box protein [Planctomycetes bacterium]|nr:PAS domain S-box protein [Planctomycetota bacterium]
MEIDRDKVVDAPLQAESAHRVDPCRNLIEGTGIGCLMQDAQGRILEANRAYVELTGRRSCEEILGRKTSEWTAPHDRQREQDALRKCLAEGRIGNLELDYLRPDGNLVPVEINSIVEREGKQILIKSLCRCIEDKRAAKKELLASIEQAEAASRAKSAFLANMSHEIRTPMNGLLGMAQLLSWTDLNDRQRDYVNAIRTCGESLIKILNDILDISSIESGRVELHEVDFSLDEIMLEVKKLFAIEAMSKNLALVSDLDRKIPPRLQGDALKIKQVLTHLVANALKFTDTGAVTLLADVEFHIDHCELKLEVIDTGVGIAAEDQVGIFDIISQQGSPFDHKCRGSGLGLAICSQTVGLMGGSMSLESEPGSGSSFSFRIPLKIPLQANANFKIGEEDSRTFDPHPGGG